MKKMTITEAAEYFGISKEAIHNRVRRGSLLVEMIDGEKHVYIDENASIKLKNNSKKSYNTSVNHKNIVQKTDERYYNLLKEQNTQLQEKVDKLENETRTLRDQKEQMLINERIKIEQIYKDKDEQLKNIINAISANFMLNAPEVNDNITSENIDADIIEEEVSNFEKQINIEITEPSILTSLNKYLKARDFSKKQRKKIKKRFERNADEDSRVIKLNHKLYIDLGKYSYKDYSL